MSIFSRHQPAQQQRAMAGGYFMSSNQLIPTRPPFATAGVPVTQTTALQKVALLSGCNLVANMPELLPADVQTSHGGVKRDVKAPPVVLDPEAGGYGLGDFGYKFITSAMLRGNVFTRVDEVDRDGRPLVVTCLNPDEVSTRRNPQTGAWEFVGLDGKPMPRYGTGALRGSIIHTRAFPQPGQLLGLSIVAQHARTLGLSIASEQFAADFFADGAHPTGILTTKNPVTQTQAKTIKTRFTEAVRGSREPVVLGDDVQYKQIQVAPGESQFLEVQKFTAAEVCRMIGPGVAELLGYETGGSMTYQNVQSRSLHVLIYAVDPWISRLERMISTYFLPAQQTLTFDRDALLRMTAGDRWTVFVQQLRQGARTINEVRAVDGLPPVPWGDEPYLPAFGPTAAAAMVKTDMPPLADPASTPASTEDLQ